MILLAISDVIEDINTNFREHLKSIPGNNVPSADTVRNTYNSNLAVVFHAGTTGKLKAENIIFLPLYFAGSFAKHGIKRV